MNRVRLSPWHITLAVLLVYLLIVFASAGFDAKVFATIDPCFAACDNPGACDPTRTGSYDGQFAYYIARAPAGAAQCLDVPAYRYQRILLPLVGRAVALGVTDWLPLTMVAVNLVVHVVATALLTSILQEQRANRWFALIYGLFAGLAMAVRLNTPEPLSVGLVVIALWFWRSERTLPELLALLGAVLAKETALVFIAGWLLMDVLARRWRHSALLVVVVCVPFAIWQLVLYAWLGSFGIGSGGALSTRFELLPFNGLWRIAGDAAGNPSVLIAFGVLMIPLVVLPSIWGLWRAGRDLLRGQNHLYLGFVLMNGLMMWTLPFSTFREPLGTMRVMSGLVLSLLLYAAMRQPRGFPLRYMLVWFALFVFVLAG
ncbi:MAG: hypothetical protein KJ065_12250 [Anaerolineae bacterium]|nr:hypothetical protein [Anaerolineae bacterium]